MKQEHKKLLLVGASVLGTICAIAAIKKRKEKPLEPEFDDWDDDFDEPFFDEDFDPEFRTEPYDPNFVGPVGSVDIHVHLKEENDE